MLYKKRDTKMTIIPSYYQRHAFYKRALIEIPKMMEWSSRFDEDRCKELSSVSNGNGEGDFAFWEETLCETSEGKFVLFLKGGGFTEYARHLSDGGRCAGSRILPMTKKDVVRYISSTFDDEDSDTLYSHIGASKSSQEKNKRCLRAARTNVGTFSWSGW